MAFVYGLNKGAEFGDAIGQTDTANAYRTLAEEILTETEGVHWNGEYIYESSNRQVDGAVAQAIATFGEYIRGCVIDKSSSNNNSSYIRRYAMYVQKE